MKNNIIEGFNCSTVDVSVASSTIIENKQWSTRRKDFVQRIFLYTINNFILNYSELADDALVGPRCI